VRDLKNPDVIEERLKELLNKSDSYFTFLNYINLSGDVSQMTKLILKLRYTSFKEYYIKNKGIK